MDKGRKFILEIIHESHLMGTSNTYEVPTDCIRADKRGILKEVRSRIKLEEFPLFETYSHSRSGNSEPILIHRDAIKQIRVLTVDRE